MSDYSSEYAIGKKSNIFIGRSQKLVTFKPFLKSFSYDIKYGKDSQDASVYTPVELKDEFEEASYKFSIDVVAGDAIEAISNHSKYQKLLRIIMPIGEAALDTPFLYVKFSNLINNNSPTAYGSMSYSKLVEVGKRGTIEKLDYKPDLNMGFFEQDGLIFAKSFSLDISFLIANEADAGVSEVVLDEKDRVIHGQRSGFVYGRSALSFGEGEGDSPPPVKIKDNSEGNGEQPTREDIVRDGENYFRIEEQ